MHVGDSSRGWGSVVANMGAGTTVHTMTLVFRTTDPCACTQTLTHDITTGAAPTGNMKGEGLVLGSVMVVSSTGQMLFHHKEKVVGDHPDDEELRAAMMAAIAQLGNTGVVSCECADDKKKSD